MENNLKNNKDKADLLAKIRVWDEKAETGSLSLNEVESREEDVAEFHRLESIRMSNIRKKCRVKWAVEGDENSRYFHASLNNNRRKTTLWVSPRMDFGLLIHLSLNKLYTTIF